MPGANTYASPSTAGGNREDLADTLTIIAPESAPVASAIKKAQRPGATYTEWMVDSLRAPSLEGAPEGEDVTSFSNKASSRFRLGNTIHIARDSYMVTDLERMVDVAGAQGGNLYNEAKAKAMIEVKRDIEATLCGGQAAASGNAVTKFTTRGLYAWCASSLTNPVGGTAVPAAFISPTRVTLLDEATLATGLQNLFMNYGEAKNYFGAVGVTLVDKIDKFSATIPLTAASAQAVGQNNGYVSGRVVTRAVNRYVTSFGTIDLIPDQFVNATSGAAIAANAYGLILNMDLLSMHIMDPLHSVELEDHGGGPRGFVKTVFALCVKNPAGIGRIESAAA